VVFNVATDGLEVVLEGLKVTGGRRGIYVDTGPTAEITLRELQIAGNGVGDYPETRAGLMILGQGTVSLEGVEISNNDAFGIWAFGWPSITIKDSTISQNSVVGVYLQGHSTATIQDSTISQNEASGVELEHQATITIKNGQIANNGSQGVRLEGYSEATVEGSVISANAWEGILISDSAEAMLIGNQIVDNKPSPEGKYGDGVEVVDGGRATLRRNTITGNARFGIGLWENARATIEDNDINYNDSHGINIGSKSTPNETVEIEVTRNRIQNNGSCGVRTDQDRGIKITGWGNTIMGNADGNLCGDLSKFPRGFGGGR